MSASSRLLRTTSSSPSSAPARHALTAAATRRSTSFWARTPKKPQPVAVTTAKPLTTLQPANPRNLPEVWFSPTFPYRYGLPPLGPGPEKPPDERKAKLGKSQ